MDIDLKSNLILFQNIFDLLTNDCHMTLCFMADGIFYCILFFILKNGGNVLISLLCVFRGHLMYTLSDIIRVVLLG